MGEWENGGVGDVVSVLFFPHSPILPFAHSFSKEVVDVYTRGGIGRV